MTGIEPESTINRRRLLFASGAVAAAGAAGSAGAFLPRQRRPDAVEPAVRAVAQRPAPHATTTLETTARLGGAPHTGTYRRLESGPGWPMVVREEIAPPRAGRADRRTPLACFVQFTDLHIADVQNPLRTEFLRSRTPTAWRAQEALTVAGAVALVEKVNALGNKPALGTATGVRDDHGRQHRQQLRHRAGVVPHADERRTDHPQHWGPQDVRRRPELRDSAVLAPGRPGAARLRQAARTAADTRLPRSRDPPLTSPGLRIPWYSTVGNHDDLPGGCLSPALGDFAVGSRKLLSVPDTDAAAYAKALGSGDDPKSEVLTAILNRHATSARTVTPDERRRLFTPHDYLAAHLDPDRAGAGPVGHGYTPDHLDGDRMYYTFQVAENVIGISIDTTYRSGHYEGSLGDDQMRWLEQTLAAHSSRSYDADGRLVRRPGADDAHILVFSHHHSPSMTRRPDAARTDEPRHDGAEVIALLSRFPNVVAWINGHSHVNRITPTRTRRPPAPSGRSTPPRTSTIRTTPGCSNWSTTRTGRCPCSPRSSSRPPRTARHRTSTISRRSASRRCTGRSPTTPLDSPTVCGRASRRDGRAERATATPSC